MTTVRLIMFISIKFKCTMVVMDNIVQCIRFDVIQLNSYVYFRHKKSIYYQIYIQLDKI